MIIYVNGHQVLIDDEDYQKANYGRSLFVKKNKFVIISIRTGRRSGKHVFLSRRIMGVENESHLSVQVDHINGNRLDNRKANLRICTHAQNQRNKIARQYDGKGHSFKGVTFLRKEGRWRARLTVNKKSYCGGVHKTPEQAARAYDELAKKYHGEFARLNFP